MIPQSSKYFRAIHHLCNDFFRLREVGQARPINQTAARRKNPRAPGKGGGRKRRKKIKDTLPSLNRSTTVLGFVDVKKPDVSTETKKPPNGNGCRNGRGDPSSRSSFNY